jgi:hypothetical protein
VQRQGRHASVVFSSLSIFFDLVRPRLAVLEVVVLVFVTVLARTILVVLELAVLEVVVVALFVTFFGNMFSSRIVYQ